MPSQGANELMFQVLLDSIRAEMSVGVAEYFASGGRMHTQAQCQASRRLGGPQNCVIHNPSSHHMREWPMTLRSSTLIERRCEHGVGHPDPDSAAFLNWRDITTSWSVHGCDGCCSDPTINFAGSIDPSLEEGGTVEA